MKLAYGRRRRAWLAPPEQGVGEAAQTPLPELPEPELDPDAAPSPARFDWALNRLRREIQQPGDGASR